MKLRSLLISAILLCINATCYAQSANERIADAMNRSAWFELDSIYRATPKDSIMDFLEVFSRCLLGNRLNRPEESVQAFTELFKTQLPNMDLSNIMSSSMMFAMDLSRIGKYGQAAELLTSVSNQVGQYVDSITVSGMQQHADVYKSLSKYRPYGITFAENSGRIPFQIIDVGPVDKKGIAMQITGAKVNGNGANITFDTGAGTNIISDSLATAYDLEFLDAEQTIVGGGHQNARYAIAKELKLGNITLTDVPFCVTNISSNNAEADQYLKHLNIIIGSEVMLRLNDLTFDFDNKLIEVPAVAPTRTSVPANMCFSPIQNLITQGNVNGKPMLINIDTGDVSNGTLGSAYFNAYQESVVANGTQDTLRIGGIGGVNKAKCYYIPNVEMTIGGSTVAVEKMPVIAEEGAMVIDYDCNLGLKSLVKFGKIHFNMVDFTITVIK